MRPRLATGPKPTLPGLRLVALLVALPAGLRQRGHAVSVDTTVSGAAFQQRVVGGWLGAAEPRRDGVALGQQGAPNASSAADHHSSAGSSWNTRRVPSSHCRFRASK